MDSDLLAARTGDEAASLMDHFFERFRQLVVLLIGLGLGFRIFTWGVGPSLASLISLVVLVILLSSVLRRGPRR